jgi:hypothetical protein
VDIYGKGANAIVVAVIKAIRSARFSFDILQFDIRQSAVFRPMRLGFGQSLHWAGKEPGRSRPQGRAG